MKAIFLAAMLSLAPSPAIAPPDRSAKAKFIGNPGLFFGPQSYPVEARRLKETGRVAMTLTIGADGRVTDCKVTSAPLPNLDKESCNIAISKVTFEPARNASGTAIASSYDMAVRWQLDSPSSPSNEFVPTTPIDVSTTEFKPGLVETEIIIDEQGRVASCRLSQGRAMGDVCAAYPVGMKMGSGYLRNGKPIRAIMRDRREMTTEFLP